MRKFKLVKWNLGEYIKTFEIKETQKINGLLVYNQDLMEFRFIREKKQSIQEILKNKKVNVSKGIFSDFLELQDIENLIILK